MTNAIQPGLYRQQFEIRSTGSIAVLRIAHLVAVGAQPGPTTAIVAGQHGREVAGTMAAAMAFQKLDPAKLSGTVHILPALNPLALQLRQQDFPIEADRYRKISLHGTANLDRLWDGGDSLDPILTSATEQIWESLLAPCDHLLDLHCWSQHFCPMAWAHERDHLLLSATGFPYLTLRRDSISGSLGTLRERAWQFGKPIVVVELPGQNTVSCAALDLGHKTIRNFLIAAGHLSEAPDLAETQYLLMQDSPTTTLDLPVGGIWSPHIQAGQFVEQGSSLGEVWSMETFEPIWTAQADLSGLVLFNGPPIWGEDHREHQVVYAGQRIAKIQAISNTIHKQPVA